MLNILNSYYANFFLFLFALLIFYFSVMDKKLVFRHIKMLQSFAFAYGNYSAPKKIFPDSLFLLEVTKLYYDDSHNLRKSVDFVISSVSDRLPIFLDLGVFDIHVSLCDDKRIKQLISECKSYGISI